MERLALKQSRFPAAKREPGSAPGLGSGVRPQLYLQRSNGPIAWASFVFPGSSHRNCVHAAVLHQPFVPDGLREVCRAQRVRYCKDLGLSQHASEGLAGGAGGCAGAYRRSKANRGISADAQLLGHCRARARHGLLQPVGRKARQDAGMV